MKNLAWVSDVMGDLRLFCLENNLSRSVQAMDAAMIAYTLDIEDHSTVGRHSREFSKEITLTYRENRPSELSLGIMDNLTPDQYNSN